MRPRPLAPRHRVGRPRRAGSRAGANRSVAQGKSLVMKKRRDLEIDEDLEFQQKEWRAQRIGFALLISFVLAALLGVTGMGGPLSHATAGDRSAAVFVEFERFVRRGAMSTIRLHLRANPGAVRFWVSAPYFEHVRVESVMPQPEIVSADAQRHVYTIRSGSPEVIVTLEIEHQSVGRIDVAVGLVDGPSVQFSQRALF